MGIPQPLVKINQIFIMTTVLISLLFFSNLLIVTILVGIITITTKRNPVIVISRKFLKKPSHEYIQEDREQQIFNQWIATILLTIAFIGFRLHYPLVGYISGGMVIVAAGLALSGYCVGCEVRYRYKMWKYHRSTQ